METIQFLVTEVMILLMEVRVTLLLTLDHFPLKLLYFLENQQTGLQNNLMSIGTLINIENVKFIDTAIALQFDVLLNILFHIQI